jgi:hypothetical protein
MGGGRGSEWTKKISYARDESHIGRSWELDSVPPRKIHGGAGVPRARPSGSLHLEI